MLKVAAVVLAVLASSTAALGQSYHKTPGVTWRTKPMTVWRRGVKISTYVLQSGDMRSDGVMACQLGRRGPVVFARECNARRGG